MPFERLFVNSIMKKLLVIIFTCFVIYGADLFSSDIRVGEIYIERLDVFERNDADWFFLSPLLNAFHTRTKEYIIRDELLF